MAASSSIPRSLRTREAVPALWELEWRVVDVTCQCFDDLDRAAVTPDSRIVQDLGIDSLEITELIMAIEEAFDVTLSDEDARLPFLQPLTLRSMAQWVLYRWETRSRDRPRGPVQPAALSSEEAVPFTQCGGYLSPREWMDGQLYEAIGLNREGFLQYRRRTDGMRCVLIPEAEVWIGSAAPEALPDQKPLHQASLNRFLIDAEPVSNAAYARFLTAVGEISPDVLQEWCGVDRDDSRVRQFPLKQTRHGWKPIPGSEQQPMILVSWYGANAYALWANRRDWRCYRGDETLMPELQTRPVAAAPPERRSMFSALPSEAQWEYAARGSVARDFPYGQEPPQSVRAVDTGLVARHTPHAVYEADTLPAAPVCERRGMSPFGLHHMAGNVWQWCRDWYAPDFYQFPEAQMTDAQNAETSGIRSERGGSWVGPKELARPSYRRGRPPAVRGRCLGFRCIGSLEDLS
jgi:sulfatase modifying factor 1